MNFLVPINHPAPTVTNSWPILFHPFNLPLPCIIFKQMPDIFQYVPLKYKDSLKTENQIPYIKYPYRQCSKFQLSHKCYDFVFTIFIMNWNPVEVHICNWLIYVLDIFKFTIPPHPCFFLLAHSCSLFPLQLTVEETVLTFKVSLNFLFAFPWLCLKCSPVLFIFCIL